MTAAEFGSVDIAVLVIYFVAVAATSVYAMFTFQRNTTAGYFLAGRFITFLPIGASLFVSNIGSEHFIGLAGSGAATGIGVGAFEFNALYLLPLLGWIFLPVYLASGIITLPEYLQKRFGGRRVNIFLSVASLAIYVLSKISVNLYSGSLFIQTALKWDLYASISLLIGMTAFFTISGGLAAVIYTDTIQAVLMLVGGMTLMVFAFIEVGGMNELYTKFMLAAPRNYTNPYNSTQCGYPRADSLQMLRHPLHSDIPWPGFLLGSTAACIWYWCADQVIVQRALAAKTLAHGQGGALVAGYLKILPLFMIVMPGMISRVLYPDEIACALPKDCERICGNRAGCTNLAYPKLVMELMPVGLRGLMVAVMLAALITDLTSIYNSASSLFTIDIYPLFRSRASNREKMIVSRAFIVVMTVVSILWVPVVKSVQGGQLFMYIQAVQAYLGPPITAVFLIAVLWPRANEQGAFWALMAGLVSGGIRMVLDFTYAEPACGEPDNRPAIVRDVHYMYFALMLFLQTVVVMVVVSLLTKPLPKWRTVRTIFCRRFDATLRPDEFVEALLDEKTTDGQIAVNEDETNVDAAANEKVGTLSSDHPNDAIEEGGELSDNKTGENKKHSFSWWLRFSFSWWCGLQESPEQSQLSVSCSRAKAQNHVDNLIELLKQGPKTYLALSINLCLILIVTILLYIVFSLPPVWLGLTV